MLHWPNDPDLFKPLFLHLIFIWITTILQSCHFKTAHGCPLSVVNNLSWQIHFKKIWSMDFAHLDHISAWFPGVSASSPPSFRPAWFSAYWPVAASWPQTCRCSHTCSSRTDRPKRQWWECHQPLTRWLSRSGSSSSRVPIVHHSEGRARGVGGWFSLDMLHMTLLWCTTSTSHFSDIPHSLSRFSTHTRSQVWTNRRKLSPGRNQRQEQPIISVNPSSKSVDSDSHPILLCFRRF